MSATVCIHRTFKKVLKNKDRRELTDEERKMVRHGASLERKRQ